MVENLYHYISRKNTKTEERIRKMNEIIDIIGGEPTQYTQLMDMCIDYVLKTLKANPNEMENMEIYNMKKQQYNDLQNSKTIIIEPTFEEREMLQYLNKKTFIKNYADLYSYALSCVAQMEKEMEEYNGKQ